MEEKDKEVQKEIIESFGAGIGDFDPEDLVRNAENTMDVTRKMFAIRRLNKIKDKFNEQLKESNYFYKRKMDGIDKQIQFLEADVWAYLNRIGEQKVVTPAGTGFITTREKWNWSEDEKAILEWCEKNAPNVIKEKTERVVDLQELKKHIKSMQEVPTEIVFIADESKINIRSI